MVSCTGGLDTAWRELPVGRCSRPLLRKLPGRSCVALQRLTADLTKSPGRGRAAGQTCRSLLASGASAGLLLCQHCRRGRQAKSGELDLELPEAPGMDEANLVVKADVDGKLAEAKASRRAGVDHLMNQPSGTILGLMSRDGWEVSSVDSSRGLFEVSMPSVSYALPLGTVSIPAPRFVCTVTDSQFADEDYQERLIGDLVLVNGKGILNVDLRFFGKLTVDAAGWTRCYVGRRNDSVQMKCKVQIGMQVPKVPGLTQIMEFFVKRYASESTADCARALSKGADELWQSR
eukprot:TRINITY_DN78128_c0_g1_i1.p1 TRINITY_DN78128_c0_g1~~TRINITY_DN78128_c0_g1_i1.p1  ORF type:complete len:290 (+),score=52.15 TRINITY_DN78128_c0_g1_i1:18-887(+)